MNNRMLMASIIPMGLFASSGMAQDMYTFKEHWLAASLRIETFYNCPVDRSESITSANVGASTFGENCWEGDSDEYVSEMSPAAGSVDPTPWASSASVSSVLYSNPWDRLASASSAVGLGLSENSLISTVSMNVSRYDSGSHGCPGCEPDGKGQIAASWAAAWASGCSGAIDTIRVTPKLNSDSYSNTGYCNTLLGDPGSVDEPEPIATDLFMGFTATYLDSSGDVISSETFQGVVFVGEGRPTYIGGHLFGVDTTPPATTTTGARQWPLPPCPIDTVCFDDDISYEHEFDLILPAGTYAVEFNGESFTMEGEQNDVNEDGAVNYWDRPLFALSMGKGVNDIGYAMHADLDRNGVVDASDAAILDASPCMADVNEDGVVDYFDLNAYTALYNAADPGADLNGDGAFNFFDFSIFTSLYNSGC